MRICFEKKNSNNKNNHDLKFVVFGSPILIPVQFVVY